ncbi:DUF2795 domain-containing protein [Candidatus Daviesbacteria bacterium]|nr:DUF2795 domain-containing protein [Candidatus Daviesbacteria bacterium]
MQDKDNAMMHLKSHQNYPATKDQLVAECSNLSDFSEEDKKWFMQNLPEGTYSSADEVIKALGWSEQGSNMQGGQGQVA